METTTRPRREFRPISWLGWAALGASLIGVALLVGRLRAAPAPAADAAQSSELRDQVRRLQEQVSLLQRSARAANIAPADERRVGNETEKAGTAREAAEKTADLSEEELVERTNQRTNERYAVLERSFAAEPADGAGSRADELSLRRRVEAMEGYELSKVECRYTMCRLEIKSESPSAVGVIGLLGLEQGGEVRRREDGTFLIFAGRAGFPFQELHASE